MSGYQPFETEHYFARHEFSAPHLLAASDCESITIAELLAVSGGSLQEMADLSLGYTDTQGSPSLRSAIASQYQSVTPDQVVVLNSPIEGIYLTMRTLLEPGDEVAVLAPSYDALRNLPEDLECDVKLWYLDETDGSWSLNLDGLASLVTDNTKLVVLNFPHNPTGYLPTTGEFARMLDIVERSGAWLYHDEMFRGLEHGTRPALPSAADLFSRSLVLGGLSKTHGLPGLRAGWLIVQDENLREEVLNTKMYTSICPPVPVQYLAEQGLTVADELARRNRALIRANLEVAEGFFERHNALFRYARPMSGPVAFVGLNVPSAHEFCESLVAASGVMLLPSGPLGLGDGHVRFGFGRASFPKDLAALDTFLAG